MVTFCRRASPVVLVVLCGLVLCRCDDDSQHKRQQQEQERQDRELLQKQLQEAQRQRDQDRRVLETRRNEAQDDTSTAIVIWLATVFALLVSIMLLVRQIHKRRVLERIVRLQMSESERRPPDG